MNKWLVVPALLLAGCTEAPLPGPPPLDPGAFAAEDFDRWEDEFERLEQEARNVNGR